MRPIVRHIRNGWQPGDVIVVFRDQPGFEYYAEQFGFSKKDYITGDTTPLIDYLSSVRQEITGINLWVVYGHATNADAFTIAQRSLMQYLDTIGTKTQTVEEPGVTLDVYKARPPIPTSSDHF